MKILIALILIMPVIGLSQNITTSTISWDSFQNINTQTGEFKDEQVRIITSGKNQVRLVSANGIDTNSFEVTGVVGNWSNIANPGEIRYDIINGEIQGTITIRKTSSETKALIMIEGEPQMEYIIINYQVL